MENLLSNTFFNFPKTDYRSRFVNKKGTSFEWEDFGSSKQKQNGAKL